MVYVHRHESGQTVIEVTVAFFLLLLVLSVVVALIVTSVSNVTFLNNQNIANKYAQDGMEELRYIERNDFQRLDALAEGSYCMNAANPTVITTGGCAAADLINSTFERLIFIDRDSGHCTSNTAAGNELSTEVTVRVAWNSGKCGGPAMCHSAEVRSCFRDTNLLRLRP